MEVCQVPFEARHPYGGRRGSAPVPALRLEVWAPPMTAAVADHFAIDTGCDFDLAVARPLRDKLREGGVRPSRSTIRWGRPLLAERYRVEALCGGRWRLAEAYHPLGPTVDEKLVGLPTLGWGAICLRPGERATWLGRARR